jgi:hypothetical protein
MQNWPTDHVPFSGALNGQEFSATYSNGSPSPTAICQFRGGTLSGRFSPDFSTFDAFETLTWGSPNAETRVQRHWVGSRLTGPM